jgi:hypothetical protein
MTQLKHPKDLILQQLRCGNPKSGSDMRLRASGTNSCSAVIKISDYQKQTYTEVQNITEYIPKSMYREFSCYTQQNIGRFMDDKGNVHPTTGYEDPEEE